MEGKSSRSSHRGGGEKWRGQTNGAARQQERRSRGGKQQGDGEGEGRSGGSKYCTRDRTGEGAALHTAESRYIDRQDSAHSQRPVAWS